MKRVLVDKILLIIIAVACCILIIPLSADLPPYWMLISIPFFWLAKLINKKYPNFPELHQSAANCDKEKLLELITVGTDINTKDNYGQTAIVHLFINADRNVTDQIEYIKILLGHGFNINEVMTQKNARASILDLAIELKTNSEIIDLLRKHGAKHGTIHSAAYGGDIEAVKEFLAAGADVNAKVNDGRTPLDMAIQQKNPEIADLLRKHGGKTGEELKAEGK